MIYDFVCDECSLQQGLVCRPFHPPQAPLCTKCDGEMRRIYSPQIICDTADPSFVPETARVTNHNTGLGKAAALKKERAYQKALNKRRRDLADGGNKGSFRHSHSVPAELYHGKIRQTGDKDYWKDPKNLNRHKDCKVG